MYVSVALRMPSSSVILSVRNPLKNFESGRPPERIGNRTRAVLKSGSKPPVAVDVPTTASAALINAPGDPGVRVSTSTIFAEGSKRGAKSGAKKLDAAAAAVNRSAASTRQTFDHRSDVPLWYFT